MPLSSEHLAVAEETAAVAHRWLTDGQLELARAYADMASLHVNLALARHTIIGNTPPPAPPPANDLPPWCGKCDGPAIGLRWITVGESEALARCPDCHPRSLEQRKEGDRPSP
ncbi:hypothetical protein [Streptomyces olivaceoviridis]|uniref:hypothetical protein n=1 Tax=Streptomyces olivaceoviridis TaxID=1921 RepID=UPI00378CEBC4